MTLLNAVTETIGEHEDVEGDVIVTSFVLIAAFVGTDGDSHIYGDTLDGQRCHETLGLLSYGLALENQRAIDQGDGE